MRCQNTKICRHQPLPEPGAFRLDLTLKALAEVLRNEVDARLYLYIIKSVNEEVDENGDPIYVQRGSAPNWQGGLVTLCTCKHRMRTFLDCKDWKGVWVAGCTGKRTGTPWNNLVYLMRVGWAFESHCDLWNWRDLKPATRNAKAAHLHPLGDLFCPRDSDVPPYKPSSYESPIAGHSHEHDQEWHKDIYYPKAQHRQPALLVGDPEYTFVWRRPSIRLLEKLGRAERKWCLRELVSRDNSKLVEM